MKRLDYFAGRLIGWLAFVAMLTALAACATTPGGTTSPQAAAEVQLANICQQIETTYNTANVLYAQHSLPQSAVASLVALAPAAKSLCDPAHPPADMTSAVTSAQEIAQKAGLAIAGVK